MNDHVYKIIIRCINIAVHVSTILPVCLAGRISNVKKVWQCDNTLIIPPAFFVVCLLAFK